MKQLLFLVFGLFLTEMASAQTVAQGAWMVGGSAGFSSKKFKDVDGSHTEISIAPNVGYFVIDNLGVGLAVAISSFKDTDEDAFTAWSLGPFVRYYVIAGLFPEIAMGINGNNVEGSETTLSLRPAIGYSIFLNKSIALEPKLYYDLGLSDVNKDIGEFGLSIGIQAFLGRE
ncbi:MAG: outer membrane beta-barrel protein [Saprospiraceae bacterium]